MPETADPDVIETRDADRPRRRWPWIAAGITVVVAVATAILVPIVHRHRAADEVRLVAEAWSERLAVAEALHRTYDDLEDRAFPADRPALEAAGRALVAEAADRVESIANRLAEAFMIVPSVRDVRRSAVAALRREIAERRELSFDSLRFTPILSDETTAVLSAVSDQLVDELGHWDVQRPLADKVTLRAGEPFSNRLDMLLDTPLPYVIVVGYAGETTLNLSTNEITKTPRTLRRKNLVFGTRSSAVFHTWKGDWEFVNGGPVPQPLFDKQASLLFPATGNGVWTVKQGPPRASMLARPLSLSDGVRGRSFPLPQGAPAGGLRDGVLLSDQEAGEALPFNTSDFAASDEASRLVLVEPDGSQRTIAHGCDDVLLARHDHVLWMPCYESPRRKRAHLTNVRTGRSVLIDTAVGNPRRTYGNTSAASSPDGRWMATPWGRGPTAPPSLGIVDTRRGEVNVLDGPGVTRQGLVWSPDSRYLFFTTRLGIGLWDVAAGTTQLIRYRTPLRLALFAVLQADWFS